MGVVVITFLQFSLTVFLDSLKLFYHSTSKKTVIFNLVAVKSLNLTNSGMFLHLLYKICDYMTTALGAAKSNGKYGFVACGVILSKNPQRLEFILYTPVLRCTDTILTLPGVT